MQHAHLCLRMKSLHVQHGRNTSALHAIMSCNLILAQKDKFESVLLAIPGRHAGVAHAEVLDI